jgi:acetyl-CoA carboxylase carboxyl transferase subunit beta
MNWLTNFVRPKIRALVRKDDDRETLWEKCPSCGQMVFHRDLSAAMRVCPHCDHHLRLSAKDRLGQLFDDGVYERIAIPGVQADPLKFRDEKKYVDRLKESRSKTGENESVVVAAGKMGALDAVAVVQYFAFMGGSMGLAVGEALIAGAARAIADKAPLIVFAAAGGARMQEGIYSLMQMPRATIAVEQVREAGLPYIVVLTDPTTGGVTASFAMIGDIQIAEPGALIGFAGPRGSQNTSREQLPDGFQRAEYLLDHGMIDMVTHRHELKATLVRLIDLLMNKSESLSTPTPAISVPALQEATAIADAPDGAPTADGEPADGDDSEELTSGDDNT